MCVFGFCGEFCGVFCLFVCLHIFVLFCFVWGFFRFFGVFLVWFFVGLVSLFLNKYR